MNELPQKGSMQGSFGLGCGQALADDSLPSTTEV